MKRALFVGRFQPPHLGHIKLIEYILDNADEIIIAIAAAQISHTIKNPFTAGERLTMLRLMLNDAKINPNRYWLIPTQDIMDNALWVQHLKRLLPKFDVAYGNNPFTHLLFKEAGVEVRNTPLFKRELYEARQIRINIRDNLPITNQVPESVINYLSEINANQRLKSLYANDSFSSTEASSKIDM